MRLERSWTGKREHRNLSFRLAHATATELGALVIPLLRSALHEVVLEAQTRSAPEISESCLVWMEGQRAPLFSLYQVFQQDEIGEDKLQRSREAIRAFAEGGPQTDVFLFLHNRDGRDPAFRKVIQMDLDTLAASGSSHLLYVAGARISSKTVRSTKDYLQHCINEEELFEDFPEEDHPILAQLVRPVIEDILHDPEMPLRRCCGRPLPWSSLSKGSTSLPLTAASKTSSSPPRA